MRAFVCVAAAAALVFGAGCKGADPGPGTAAADSTAVTVPDQELWDSEVVLSSGGRTTVRLHAEHIATYDKQKRTLLDTVRVNFYNADGSQASVLTALRGRVDEKTSDLEAMGDVVVRSEEGITLETDKLFWRNEMEKIVSDSPVRLTTDRDTVTGVGLESDPRLENWQIKRNISGTFRRDVAVPASAER